MEKRPLSNYLFSIKFDIQRISESIEKISDEKIKNEATEIFKRISELQKLIDRKKILYNELNKITAGIISNQNQISNFVEDSEYKELFRSSILKSSFTNFDNKTYTDEEIEKLFIEKLKYLFIEHKSYRILKGTITKFTEIYKYDISKLLKIMDDLCDKGFFKKVTVYECPDCYDSGMIIDIGNGEVYCEECEEKFDIENCNSETEYHKNDKTLELLKNI